MNNSESKDKYCPKDIDESELSGKRESLLGLKVGEKGIVVRIAGGHGACKRLNELGLVPGTKVEVVNKIASGPVMIRVKGSKLALGRGLANKVEVIKK